MKKNKMIKTLIILLIMILIMVFFALCLGKYPISLKDSLSIIWKSLTFRKQSVEPMAVNVVLKLRLPRIVMSLFVGAALSISGACYQGIFKNPLVSPDFLGVSSGACIGAALGILLGLSSSLISALAFIFGLLAVLLTSIIPLIVRNRSNIILVLSGIIVGSLMSSILGFIKYVADPNTQLASITYWTMGSFSYASLEDIFPMIFIMIPPMIIIFMLSWWVDVLSMGEEEANILGANVKLIRTIIIICSTLLTAGSICFAGTIGWVGLIIPHLSRMLVGSSNKRILPVSCLLGGLFMLIVDTITRIIGVTEMPISIMTGIIGVPFFIWLLFKRKDEII